MNTSTCYHICINGYLDERWLDTVDDYSVETLEGGRTQITVTVVDQPALFSVMNRIRDLDLELISVLKDESGHSHSV